jgi:hypothetical protein
LDGHEVDLFFDGQNVVPRILCVDHPFMLWFFGDARGALEEELGA